MSKHSSFQSGRRPDSPREQDPQADAAAFSHDTGHTPFKNFQPVRSVILVIKEGNPAAEEEARNALLWLRQRDVPTFLARHGREPLQADALPQADLLLTFGGDGTLVSVARRMLGREIPMAGVNFGRVGFLAELNARTWRKSLEAALERGVRVEPRMALRYALFREGDLARAGEVVNDVVVTRGKVARLVRLHLGVNGAPFTSLRSDGLILSSPTGASGYAGSAGGPLLLPTLNDYVVAAICPYLSSFPPLVLNARTVFSVTVGEVAADLYLTLDGQEAYALDNGDILEVSGVPERFLMADFGLKDYFSRLLAAGFVQESKSRPEEPGGPESLLP